ncbi:MAG: helix-turn-helix domain-containing protein [Reyranella sp.]
MSGEREEANVLIDQADISRAKKVVRDIAAGDDEVVPADVVRRLIAGENKVKVWRSHRGLSGHDLAAAAGISAPFVSEIESGKKDASLSVMKKIADVLKVDLDDLV